MIEMPETGQAAGEVRRDWESDARDGNGNPIQVWVCADHRLVSVGLPKASSVWFSLTEAEAFSEHVKAAIETARSAELAIDGPQR